MSVRLQTTSSGTLVNTYLNYVFRITGLECYLKGAFMFKIALTFPIASYGAIDFEHTRAEAQGHWREIIGGK